MKLIKRLLLCFIILIPFLASCSNDSDTNEKDEYGSYLYLEYALSTQSFELGAEREIRNIHFSTEGYNYYGDFQILIDDTVI
nr:hypothetical protein [Acholeplasmatales bacterium]